MASTYTPIATATATGSQSTITFSSIPNTYTDLRLVIIGNSDNAGQVPYLRFNGSASGYNFYESWVQTNGTFSTGTSQTTTASSFFLLSQMRFGSVGGGQPAMAIVDINGYTITSTNLTSISVGARISCAHSTNSAATPAAGLYSGIWVGGAVVSSISATIQGPTNWTAGSTFTLYGILGA